MRALLTQFARFGVVGGVGFLIDLGIFNLLIATVLHPDRLHEGPVIAKAVSTSVAIGANWVGNRFWTFREHRGRRVVREGVEFGIVSVGGMGIGLLCLWVSRYLLGFESVLADNVAANVVGLGLGTAFRFALYRSWVFAPRRGERLTEAERDAAAARAADAGGSGSEGSGAAGSAVRPAGLAPDGGVEAVAAVDDGSLRDR
ncbi:GtrA family protein [Homoserinibacter sp. YIM 151385]|uniref:GtrA family protein n=1 Tax=Homoserinibacter sp. YIM 151385 TaxID=2985506 RepID=UPI0022F10AC5|nr:GtrA family protein [Homoserinibacter sp. YIM 151385]WBU36794.1 GtrA family protein [Homoserinibacter sp. YIM 151385]